MLILNDIHLGVKRTAGTTTASAAALSDYLFASFSTFLSTQPKVGEQVVILGDLFDQFSVSISDWLTTYEVLSDWLEFGDDNTLTLVAGNHDLSKDTTRRSSFDLLCRVLRKQHPEKVEVVSGQGVALVDSEVNAYVIPHVSNQDLFDHELEKALDYFNSRRDASGFPVLLLHANFDNGFAAESDHSLNVSRAWADRFSSLATLVFAHEHQARRRGNVYVIGNQWPSSVADCLGNDRKDALRIDEEGLTRVPTWRAKGSFVEHDYRKLGDAPAAQFVRVTGHARPEEAAEVVEAIAKLRQSSEAFVITNAVQFAEVADGAQLLETIEAVQNFDGVSYLLSLLAPEQAEKVKELLRHAE